MWKLCYIRYCWCSKSAKDQQHWGGGGGYEREVWFATLVSAAGEWRPLMSTLLCLFIFEVPFHGARFPQTWWFHPIPRSAV